MGLRRRWRDAGACVRPRAPGSGNQFLALEVRHAAQPVVSQVVFFICIAPGTPQRALARYLKRKRRNATGEDASPSLQYRLHFHNSPERLFVLNRCNGCRSLILCAPYARLNQVAIDNRSSICQLLCYWMNWRLPGNIIFSFCLGDIGRRDIRRLARSRTKSHRGMISANAHSIRSTSSRMTRIAC